MFPFTSFEATKFLVDEHIAELRRSGRSNRYLGRGRRHPGRVDPDTRAAR
jgi:hypothetical protein